MCVATCKDLCHFIEDFSCKGCAHESSLMCGSKTQTSDTYVVTCKNLFVICKILMAYM